MDIKPITDKIEELIAELDKESQIIDELADKLEELVDLWSEDE